MTKHGKDRITGATIGWSLDVVICFDHKYVLPGKSDRKLFKEYYKHRDDWPCDPETGKPLPVE